MTIGAFRSGRINVRIRDLLGGLAAVGFALGGFVFWGFEFSLSEESSYIDG